MRIEAISIQGSTEWNEDSLIRNDRLQLFGVLDGATSLRPYRGANNETGGYLASNLIKEYIESLDAEELSRIDLRQAVIQANHHLRESMLKSGVDVTDKTALWTSALALVRIRELVIDYAQVGDCMIIAEYRNGRIRALSHDQVSHIDEESKRLWEEGINNGIEKREELWELVKPNILRNKARMNTLHGYSVMSGEPELERFIEHGTISRSQLKSLLIVTDGLFVPKERGGGPIDPVIELMERVAKSSLEQYANWLIDLEMADPECRLYPRFKISDDKTGIWIRFPME